jgi:hypothetical protein
VRHREPTHEGGAAFGTESDDGKHDAPDVAVLSADGNRENKRWPGGACHRPVNRNACPPMSRIDRFERRFGWLSFPGFLRYYAILHGLVYVLQIFRPDIGMLLEFDRAAIFSGEVWRLVTFLFSSSGFGGIGAMGAIFFFFMIMIAFMMSDAIEGAWGVFRTSLFYYCGILGLIVANLVFPHTMQGSGFLLYGAAFFAFATLFPRVEFLLFFILPVQVRVLAWIKAGVLVLGVLGNFWLLPFFLLAYANYLVFAGIPALRGSARVMESAQRRRKFNAAKEPEHVAFHTCSVCGRTDASDPELEFRVGPDGREYCDEHLPE